MSTVSPNKSARGAEGSQSPVKVTGEVEFEAAFLRSVVETRPVGQHRHVLMIQLQNELYKRTKVWMPFGDLWDKVGEMFDLDRLDNMYNPPSLPGTPQSLSPLPRRDTARRGSSPLSPHPSAPSYSPPPEPSSSAKCINSDHFRTVFNLPYLRLGEEEWKPNLYQPNSREGSTAAAAQRRRSRSVASSSVRPETEVGEVDPELSEGEEKEWHELIYKRAEPAEVIDEDGDEQWEEQVTRQLAEGDKAREKQQGRGRKGKAAAATNEAAAPPKKKLGRPSKADLAKRARAARDESSELSDEAEAEEEEGEAEEEGQEEEQEEEEEAEEEPKEEETPRPSRGRRSAANAAASGKRKRDSNAKEESEEEPEVTNTKTRRKKR